ncbi:MAG: DUF1592 domain-containing protein [Deltaproteobacteria bacterium]|nr:DUF1592 domain-containing protein [Nannocystaceae bacterium]
MGIVLRSGRGCVVACTMHVLGCYHGGAQDHDVADTGVGSEDGSGASESGSTGDAPGSDVASGPTGLRLLTPTQYRNSVIDALGDVAAPAVGQWRSSIAAAQGGVAAAGVEDYEAAALAVTQEIFGDPTRRMALTGCTPTASADDACVRTVISAIGRRAWRRPLDDAELARWSGVALSTASLVEGDAWLGLQYAVAGLLQSPNFLYRVELGTPVSAEDPLLVRLDGYELASRLSYLVWNTTPDDALLDAVGAGELDEDAGIEAQIDRLFASPRATDGMVQLFVDMLDLDALLSLQKDAELVPAFTPTMGPAMREEMVRVIADTVITQRDYRRLLDTTEGHVNAELAALYGIEGTFDTAFTPAPLPAGRGGLLTLAGFLAINSGEASTSPTIRGLTVRRMVMCQDIPPPPPDAEADLPEPGDDTPMTKREQLEQHVTDPTCAGCHDFMDPMGLALEHFDALGGWRETDKGLVIDPSGNLDGVPFADAVALGSLLAEHPQTGDCVVRNLYRYATGHIEQPSEQAAIDLAYAALVDNDHDLTAAVDALARSESFRHATLSEEDAP